MEKGKTDNYVVEVLTPKIMKHADITHVASSQYQIVADSFLCTFPVKFQVMLSKSPSKDR